jgi:aspartate 1-decarboxylase
MNPITYRTLLHSKIHRAVVTSADVDYEGSLKVDTDLLEAAGMREFELVQVADVENGARLETYLIAGPAGSGVVQPNGAAEPLPENWSPIIVLVDEKNRIREVRHG